MLAENFQEPRDAVSVVLVDPDTEVYFQKVGGRDLRADWTDTARENLRQAVAAHLEASGETVVDFETLQIGADDLEQLQAMNLQVTSAIGSHRLELGNVPFLGALPHKDGRLKDLAYSLGDTVDPIRAARPDADYAVFTTHRSTIESAGSFLTKVAIGTVTGFVPAASSFRGTLVNLVDLDTGEVVWVNGQVQGTGGDVREAQKATNVIADIMDESPLTPAGAAAAATAANANTGP